MMESIQRILPALIIACLSLSATAQPGPGGAREGRGFRFNQANTPGWTLMTTQERATYRDKMLSSKTYAECKSIQAEKHALMEARAKEKGRTLPAPRSNACDNMKARGLIK